MFIYSNIAASSPVGNTFAPLLCTVHLEIDDKMQTLHKNYTTIHIFLYTLQNLTPLKSNCVTCMGITWCSTGGICYRPPFSKSWRRNVAEKNERKGDIRSETVPEKMKWSWLDYEAMIGLRKERQKKNKKKKKKRQKKKPTSGALHATKALLHSMMLAKLLGRDNKNAQQKRAIAATLSKSNMNGMGRLWKKFLNSKYPLPQKQIKQLI